MIRVSAFVVLLSAIASAQTERIVSTHRHAWVNYFGNHPVSKRWGAHVEGQWRRSGAFEDPMQLLLRWGANYYLTPNVTLTGGYAYIRTHRYGSYPVAARFPEHRIWQQALVVHRLRPRAALQHRYRLEQRYLGQTGPARWRYENRFRYMLRADFTLTQRDNRPDWYIGTYNELFVNFGKNVAANVFDQNRAYVALGKSAGRVGRFEVGYMNQLLQQRNGRIFENNHTLMVSFFSGLRFRN